MFAAKNELFTRPSGGYQIQRSLRFNSADSAYLNRTPASTTNQRTWTFSAWIKRSKLSTNQRIFQAREAATGNQFFLRFSSDNTIYITGSSGAFELQTTQLFRDPSAWYHIVFACDTTQATSSNRFKLYINGSQVTAFGIATYPSQNLDTTVNSTWPHGLGAENSGPSEFYDGYMTEVNLIDGTALTPSSFGETNAQTGVWQPKAYSGSYGTNGFYLNFSDNSNTTAATLGKDYSGNGNNWTPNNFSVTAGAGNDSLVDSPTSYGTDTGVGGTVRGNYATLNPLLAVNNTAQTYSNGNLQITDNGSGSLSGFGVSTIDMTSGKWYVEATVTAIGTGATFGIWQLPILATTTFSSQTNYRWYSVDGKIYNASGATANSYATWGTSDVLSVAVDMDAGSVTFYKNGTSQGSAITGLTGSWVVGFNPGGSNTIFNANFGQRPFAYTAPSGFKALCTQNLPTPTIGATTATQANKYFDINLWTGNGSSQTLTNSGGFQPDWVWLKSRSSGTNFHNLYDVLRGATKHLFSNTTAAEGTNAQALTAFTSTGFSVGNDNDVNQSSGTYVGWQWKANGSGSSNTAGSITSTVSANTTSGFSVVTYTGTGSAATVGHGLGATPKMIIGRSRTNSGFNWGVWHTALQSLYGNTAWIRLNTTGAYDTTFDVFDPQNNTSSVFGIGTEATMNANSSNYVAYCFAEVAGYSAFGSYTGNGSADGPFVYTGFRPAYVMAKKSSGIEIWYILDSKRGTYNVNKPRLNANNPDAESSAYDIMDFTSNGFKFRNSDTSWNGSGDTYIFAAFAESPFKYSLARQD